MKFFNIDLHISVIEDIKKIFGTLEHQVDSWNISGHNWVFNRQIPSIDIINQDTWKNLDQSLCDRFYERYKNELSNYDAFIACYPPAFALLYERFNKPIYIVAATRYEYPFSNNQERWNWLNYKLQNMIDSKQIIPITNNKYDKFYCEYFLDREFHHIPSVCKYTGAKYHGINDPIVSGRSSIDGFNHISQLGRFRWHDLYSHKAIIHIPYNVSIMSIFEQYTANVPLFFPTIDFGKTLPGYLSEIFFNPNTISTKETTRLLNKQALYLSDFHDEEWMPFIQYYHSLDDLYDQINSLDLLSISNDMKRFNINRKLKIHKLWSSLICLVK